MSEKEKLQAACTPLAQLNQYIRAARTAAHERTAELGETLEPDELASVRRFRRAWETNRTQDDVEQAIDRKPVNAGPLNSHALVLQLLSMMRGLSPHYLRHFLVHVESLQWLELASEKYPRAQAARNKAAQPVRRGRPKK